jgi:hypothetical protein
VAGGGNGFVNVLPIRRGADRSPPTPLVRRPESGLRDLCFEHPQGTAEDGGGITIVDLATQIRLKAPQPRVHVLVHGELSPVASWRGGFDDRAGRRTEYQP